MNAGIDKIKVILNPMFLAKDFPWHLRADNSLTIHRAGTYTFLAIHVEYFNPFFDYRTQIAYAIFELMEKKVILFPMVNPILTFMFILQNIEYFILGISQVEFYYDFPKNKVFVDKDAVENGDIIQYKDLKGNPTETYYSPDNDKGKSTLCVYNKREKLIKDNRMKHTEIEKMNVENRIEARLGRENCPYLAMDNFSGTFEDIYKRFLPFLGVQYYKFMFDNITVKGKGNTHFTRLVRQAKKGKVQYHNRGRLTKSEPIQELPENGTARKQMQKVILGKYYREVESEEKDSKVGQNDMLLIDLADC